MGDGLTRPECATVRRNQRLLVAAFVAGVVLLAFDSAPHDPMPLGPPYPIYGGVVVALLGAIAISSPIAAAAGDARARLGMRAQRALAGALAFFPIAAVVIALTGVLNRSSTSSPVSITCSIDTQEPRRSGGYDVTFICAVPDGGTQRARGVFDGALRPLTRAAEARRGALGIWLLPRSAVLQP